MQKLLVIFLVLIATVAKAQVKIGTNPTSVNASSLFEMESTNKGLLMPRVTTAQRTAILSPAKGLMVFDNNTSSFWFYNGNAWTEIKSDSTSVYIKDKILQVSSDSAMRTKDMKIYENYLFTDIVAATDAKGFATAGENGIFVLQDANTGYLNTYSLYNTPGNARGIDAKGNYLYVADWDSLQILSISPIARVGAVYIGEAEKVFVTGNVAYVASGSSGLKLVNVTNPATPTVISTYNTPSYALDVTVNGNYAYVADGSSFQIINIANPLSPTFTGSYPSSTENVFVNGNYAYINNGSLLNIINISNPASPVLTYADTELGNGRGMLFRNNKIYQSTTGVLAVFNVSNPSSANLVKYTSQQTGGPGEIAFFGDYIIQVNQYGGIESFRVEGTSNSLLVTNEYVQMEALSGQGKSMVFADEYGKLSKPFEPEILVSDIRIKNSWTSSYGGGLKFMDDGSITMGTLHYGMADRSRTNFGYYNYSLFSFSYEGGLTVDPDSAFDGDFALYKRVLKFGGIFSKAGIGSKAYGVGGNAAGLDFYTNNISRLALSSAGAVTIDPTGLSDGTLTNGLRFGNISHGEGITSKKTGSGNMHGLEFFTSFTNRMSITNAGDIGIGNINPAERLDVTGNIKVSGVSVLESMRIDNNSVSNGTISSAAIRFGNASSGEGILSKKTGGGNQNGLDFFTNSNARITIANGGNVGISNTSPGERLDVTGNAKVSGNVTVQNGKGVVRSNSTTQLKMGFITATVNTSLAAGATTSINFTWSESFTAAPVAYVGSVVSGSGGWAEIVMTVAEVTTTGGKLYVYNLKTSTVNPNFSINIVGIGAQ